MYNLHVLTCDIIICVYKYANTCARARTHTRRYTYTTYIF